MEPTTGTAEFGKDWQALVFIAIATPVYVFCLFRRRRRDAQNPTSWRHLQFLRSSDRTFENFCAPRDKRLPPPNPPAAVGSGYAETKFSVQTVFRRASDIFNFRYIAAAFIYSMACSYILRISPEIGRQLRYSFFYEPVVFAHMGALWKTLETVLLLVTFPFGLYMYHCLERFRSLAVLMHMHRQRLCSLALLLGEALPECIPPGDDDEVRRLAGEALAEEILHAKWTLYRFLNVANYCSYATMSARFRQQGFARSLVQTGLLTAQEAKFIEVYAAQPRNIADVAYRWICQMVIALVRAEATELQSIQGILQALTGLRDAYARLSEHTAYRQPASLVSLLVLILNVIMLLTPPSLAYSFSTAHEGGSIYLVPAMGSMLVAAFFTGSLDVMRALQTPFESRLYDLDPDWILMSTERALFEILACDMSELFRGGSGVVPIAAEPPEMPVVPEDEPDAVEESDDGMELVEVPSLPGSQRRGSLGSGQSGPSSIHSPTSGHSPRSPREGAANERVKMRKGSSDSLPSGQAGLPENLRRYSLELGSVLDEPVIEEEDEWDMDEARSMSSVGTFQSRASRKSGKQGTASIAGSVPDDQAVPENELMGLTTTAKFKGPFYGPGVEPDDVDGLLKVLHDWAAPTGSVRLSPETLERLAEMMDRHFAKIEQLLSVYHFLPDDEQRDEREATSWGDHEHLVAELLMRLHEASRGSSQMRQNLAIAGVGDPGSIAFDALFPGSQPPDRPPSTLEQRRREMVAKVRAEARAAAEKDRADTVATHMAVNIEKRQEMLRNRRERMGVGAATPAPTAEQTGAPSAASAAAAVAAAGKGAAEQRGFDASPHFASVPEDHAEVEEDLAGLVPRPSPIEKSEGLPTESVRLGRRRRGGTASTQIPEVK